VTHVFHNALEGFDERQILHDGCHECEARGRDLRSALAHMDTETFTRAWQRAFDINASNGSHDVGRESHAEADLLLVLFAVQVELQRRGVPLDGSVPHGPPPDESLSDPYRSIEQERWRQHDEGRS
jgi:hypothetical protein